MKLARFVLITLCIIIGQIKTGVGQQEQSGSQATDKIENAQRTDGDKSKNEGDDQKGRKNNNSSNDKQNRKWIDLFDGKTLKNWKVAKFGGEGEVEVEKGEIRMDYGSPITGITFTGKVPRINYEIEVEAMPIEGIDFFVGLTMPVNESHISLIVAGWAGAVVGLSNIDDKDASENGTTKFMKFELGKWYKVRARVETDTITCWINDKKVIVQDIKGRKIGIRPEVELSTPLGLSAFETRTAYRKIRIRRLDSAKKKTPKQKALKQKELKQKELKQKLPGQSA